MNVLVWLLACILIVGASVAFGIGGRVVIALAVTAQFVT
jgi:trans-2-enoyl-CoA reductase